VLGGVPSRSLGQNTFMTWDVGVTGRLCLDKTHSFGVCHSPRTGVMASTGQRMLTMMMCDARSLLMFLFFFVHCVINYIMIINPIDEKTTNA